jgi:hypothetical protein
MEFAGISLARVKIRTANYTRFDLRNGAGTLQAGYTQVQAEPNVIRCVLVKSSGTKPKTDHA